MRLRHVPLFIVLAALSTACPQSIETPLEGGDAETAADASDPADGGIVPDATVLADADLPTEDDAGSPGDAEPPHDARPMDAGTPLAPLQWSQMTVPANTAIVECIWGRSDSEIYAGTSNGNLLRFDPATGWTVVWHEPSNFGIHAIWGTPTKIFVASDTTLHVHNGQIQQVPVSYAVGRWIYDIHGTSDTDVHIVADMQNGRGYFKYDGAGVNLVIEPTGVATLSAVYGESPSRVFLGGNGHLFRYESFAANDEAVEWPAAWSQNDILNFEFKDISPAGARLFAVGERFLIFERDSAGTWKRVHEPFLTGPLRGVAGFQDEAYAVGDDVTGGSIVRFYDGTWTSGQYDQNVSLHDIWAAGPNEYFVAGTVSNTFDGVILRGSR